MILTKRIAIVIVVLLICVGLSSCAGTLGSKRGSNIETLNGQVTGVASQLRFEDLPVPTGFSLNRKESFIFQNSQTRLGTLKYEGKADVAEVIEFYKRTMSYNGWKLINSIEFGTVVLNFKKQGEGCIITMETKSGNRVIVFLNLSPLSPGNIPVEEDPYVVDANDTELVEDDYTAKVN